MLYGDPSVDAALRAFVPSSSSSPPRGVSSRSPPLRRSRRWPMARAAHSSAGSSMAAAWTRPMFQAATSSASASPTPGPDRPLRLAHPARRCMATSQTLGLWNRPLPGHVDETSHIQNSGGCSNITNTGGNNHFRDFPRRPARRTGRAPPREGYDENSITFDIFVPEGVRGLTSNFVYASEFRNGPARGTPTACVLCR